MYNHNTLSTFLNIPRLFLSVNGRQLIKVKLSAVYKPYQTSNNFMQSIPKIGKMQSVAKIFL